jgi:hypothetical protein
MARANVARPAASCDTNTPLRSGGVVAGATGARQQAARVSQPAVDIDRSRRFALSRCRQSSQRRNEDICIKKPAPRRAPRRAAPATHARQLHVTATDGGRRCGAEALGRRQGGRRVFLRPRRRKGREERRDVGAHPGARRHRHQAPRGGARPRRAWACCARACSVARQTRWGECPPATLARPFASPRRPCASLCAPRRADCAPGPNLAGCRGRPARMAVPIRYETMHAQQVRAHAHARVRCAPGLRMRGATACGRPGDRAGAHSTRTAHASGARRATATGHAARGRRAVGATQAPRRWASCA